LDGGKKIKHMKLNWGIGIAIFYICFVTAMISVVIKSCHNQSDLVKEDYYQLDLDYEDHRQKKMNAKLLPENVAIEYDKHSHSISLSFPDSMNQISGDIHLFRPSDKYLDMHYSIDVLNQNNFNVILDKDILHGLWEVRLDWSGDGVPYYINSKIII